MASLASLAQDPAGRDQPGPQATPSSSKCAQVRAEPASPQHLHLVSLRLPHSVPCACLRATSFPQMHRRVHRGIPQIRGQAWSLLLDLEKVEAENKGKCQAGPPPTPRGPSPVPSVPGTSQTHSPGAARQEGLVPLLTACPTWPSTDTGPRDGQVPPPRHLRGTESHRKGQKPGGKGKETPQKPQRETARPEEHRPD